MCGSKKAEEGSGLAFALSAAAPLAYPPRPLLTQPRPFYGQRPVQIAARRSRCEESQLSGLRLRDRDCDFNPATFRMSEFLADEVKLVGALVDRTDHGPMLHRIVVPQLG